MVSDKWTPQPYLEQELLSFDRLKRAVMNRILERSEVVMVEEFPLSLDRQASMINEEWMRAKYAVRNSPAARAAFRKHLEGIIGEQLDDRIRTDKSELESMGVAEKSM